MGKLRGGDYGVGGAACPAGVESAARKPDTPSQEGYGWAHAIWATRVHPCLGCKVTGAGRHSRCCLARQGRVRMQGDRCLFHPREMRVCYGMARGGERTASPTHSLRGRRAPCPAGASSAAPIPVAPIPVAPIPAVQTPFARNPGGPRPNCPKPENSMTCIALPPAFSM